MDKTILMMIKKMKRTLAYAREKRYVGNIITTPDDLAEDTEYQIKTVKSPETYEDQIISSFQLVWSFKDHLKKIMKHGKEIEKFADKTYELSICADVANSSKHHGLDRGKRSKSFDNPFSHYSRAKMKTASNPNLEIKFEAKKVTMDFRNPDDVEYSMIIHGEKGVIGEAEDLLEKAIQRWESYVQESNFPAA